MQYQAARAITGAYQATSSPALDIETYTLPIEQKLAKLHFISLPALPTPNYYCRTTGKTNPAFSANKRANDSQVRILVVDASLGRVFSFTNEASLDQANTIETLNQRSQTSLKKGFNTTADPSEFEISRDELVVDCKL